MLFDYVVLDAQSRKTQQTLNQDHKESTVATSSTQQLIGFRRKPDEALSAEPMVELARCAREHVSRLWDNPVCLRQPGLEKECSRPDQCPYYTSPQSQG